MKLSKNSALPEGELDMTPMIDVVFNLIIFFMLASDLSNLDVEPVILPFASRAVEGKEEEPVTKTLKVNIRGDGGIVVSRKYYTMEKDPKKLAELEEKFRMKPVYLSDFLKIEADAEGREDPDPQNPGLRPSKLKVLIRGDRKAPYKFIGDVLEACSVNTVYKTSVGASPSDPTK